MKYIGHTDRAEVTETKVDYILEEKDMTINEYANAVVESLGIDGAAVKEVEKANGVIFTAIVIPTDNNIAPTIYVDDMMKHGLTPGEAATQVLRVYDANKTNNSVDVGFVTDFEKVKHMLRARLYNEKTNADIKRSTKEFGFDDLIIVPYINIGTFGSAGEGSIKVTKEILDKWGVTADEVLDIAIENTKGEDSIRSMFDTLSDLMGGEAPINMGGPQMYVITNTKKVFGAIQVILQKEKLNEMFPSGYIVLPSSVHEVIVIPKDGSDLDFLNGLVNEVNATEVANEEVLGTKAYIF